MATATGTKTATEKAKVTASGDVGGGGGDTAIAATATAMAVMVAGSFRRFEVRKANRQIKNLFRLHVHGILFMNNGWGVV